MGGTIVILFAVPSYLSGAVSSAVPDVTVYEGDVPASPSFPYVLLQTSFPAVSERAVNRRVQGRRFTARTTVAGATARSVEVVAEKLSTALEGVRLDVDGWSLGALESVPNDQPILPDMDVTLPGLNLHPQYLVLDWVVAGSRNPA
jgi:hypothetical protein